LPQLVFCGNSGSGQCADCEGSYTGVFDVEDTPDDNATPAYNTKVIAMCATAEKFLGGVQVCDILDQVLAGRCNISAKKAMDYVAGLLVQVSMFGSERLQLEHVDSEVLV
jgi:hypothetical protein